MAAKKKTGKKRGKKAGNNGGGRRTIRTQKNRDTFLAALAHGKCVLDACEETGIGQSSAYDWRHEDEAFAEDWDAAYDKGAHARLAKLSKHAMERATEGWLEPVFYEGQECGHKRRFSDTLLVALLKRHDRGYIDRMALEGGDGGPIQVVVNKGGAA